MKSYSEFSKNELKSLLLGGCLLCGVGFHCREFGDMVLVSVDEGFIEQIILLY